jgi:propanediol utilization protein
MGLIQVVMHRRRKGDRLPREAAQSSERHIHQWRQLVAAIFGAGVKTVFKKVREVVAEWWS